MVVTNTGWIEMASKRSVTTGDKAAKAGKKAYVVLENNENTGSVYFGENRRAALRAASRDIFDEPDLVDDLFCDRAPWADIYAGAGVPASEAIKHGWRFECDGCEAALNEDDIRDRGAKVEDVVGLLDGPAYCSRRCFVRHLTFDRRKERYGTKEIERLKQSIRMRLPEAKFCDEPGAVWPGKPHVDIWTDKGGVTVREACIPFEFPGMVAGPAEFRLEPPKVGGVGPPDGCVMVLPGDLEKFLAWKHSCSQMRTSQSAA